MKKFTIKNKPSFYFNQDFQTIQINVTFPFLKRDEDVAYYNLLPNMLHLVTQKYPTEREFSLRLQELYILNSYCTYSSSGDMGMISFNFSIPDPYALKENLLDDQFAFFAEVMYAPKTKNGAFCIEETTREIDSLKVNIERAKKDPGTYVYLKCRQIIDPDGPFSFGVYCHPELIDSVNEKNLYEFYERVVYHNQPTVSVFGNVDEKEILKYAQKYLYRNSFENTTFTYEPNHYLPLRENVQEITEESDFRNSVYLSFYSIKDMREEDNVLLETIKNLLVSQATRILNKKLRDENDLVYSSSVSTQVRYGLISVMASINKDNIEIVREKILEAFDELKKEDLVEEYLDLLKERYRLGMIRQLDDKVSLFQDLITRDIGVDLTTQEYYEKLCEIHAKDISSFLNRFVPNTNYFLKEGEHE